MTIAFQSNAFQDGYPSSMAAFQSFDRYVEIELVSVNPFLIIELGPHMLEYKAGDTIVISALVKDPSQIPNILFDPTTVQINIFNPDETSRVSLGSMSKISTGTYTYTLQSSSSWPTGVYSINVKAVSGGNTAQTINQEAFKLV